MVRLIIGLQPSNIRNCFGQRLRQLVDDLDDAGNADHTAGHGQTVQNLVGSAALQENRLAVMLLRKQ